MASRLENVAPLKRETRLFTTATFQLPFSRGYNLMHKPGLGLVTPEVAVYEGGVRLVVPEVVAS